MKKLFSLLVATFALVGFNANANSNLATEIMVQNALISAASEVHINNAINWKVGEYQELDMTSTFGSLGKMKKFVASEEGNAIWVNQEVSGMMSQKAEILMDRADGKILKMRVNGQDQQIPDSKIEIIDQESTNITVPAGTFDVIHIKAKADGKNLEVWMNPRDITMDGTAQMTMDTGLIPITMKLLKFGGR